MFAVRDALHLMGRSQSVIEDTHGNVSCRDRDTIYIKPSGVPYADIHASDVCQIGLELGEELRQNGLRPSVDTEHHRSIYRRNPRVGSICHTHSPYATAWAIAGRDLEVSCTEHADYFGHPIRCLPFASLDQWGWIDLCGIEQAVLLGKHGVLICANDRDPSSAVKLAIALEAIAKKYTIAAQLNWQVPGEPLNPYEVSKWHDRYQRRYGQ